MRLLRGLSVLAATLAATLLVAAPAEAQGYPNRPITVILPFAGGSASDVVTRIMLDHMGKAVGQPFIIENRPGAGGNTGTLAAARAAADGYTLLATGLGPLGPNQVMFGDLGYDPEKDLVPISIFVVFPNIVVVSTKMQITSLKDLIAFAKAHPKQLNYGSVGPGSSQHLSGVYFGQVAGVELTHVPYRNIAQYGPDLIAGTVPLGFQWLPNVSAPLSSGGARPLAVANPTRLAALPDVPTTAEAGLPGYETSGWFAMLAPRGTPTPVIDRIHQEIAAAIAEPAVRQRFKELGAEAMAPTPDELRRFLAAENVKWLDVIVRGGIKVEQQK